MRTHASAVTTAAVMEAAEALSSIAELEIDSPIAVSDLQEISIQGVPLAVHSVHWLHRQNAEKVMSIARNTFRLILRYLKGFYRKEYGRLTQHESAESIKNVMLLVGDAAKKLDKFAKVLNGNAYSIESTREYQDLDTFYKRKVAPIIQQESLARWLRTLPIKAVLEWTKEKAVAEQQPHLIEKGHFHIDLESAKKDVEYELFLLRREDGSRFFTSRFLRNLKLLSNFAAYLHQEDVSRPETQPQYLLDLEIRNKAKNILLNSMQKVDAFLHLVRQNTTSELVISLWHACIALILAHQERPRHLMKSAIAYFNDFIKFLKQAVISSEYRQIENYNTQKCSVFESTILQLVQTLSYELYTTPGVYLALSEFVGNECGMERSAIHLHSRLLSSHRKLQKRAEEWEFLPINYSLDALQDPDIRGFDPLLLNNAPGVLFDLVLNGKNVPCIRVPSPTNQEYINKAELNEEWKAFIRRAIQKKKDFKLILFNLQDRTLWTDFARCKSIEEMQKFGEFSEHIIPVTLSPGGDFYNQTGPYQELNDSDIFMEHLIEHVEGEVSGYFFGDTVKRILFPRLVRKIVYEIHKEFFSKKNVLTRTARSEFIDLFHLVLEYQIAKILKVDAVGFVSKDGLDASLPSACLLNFLASVSEGKQMNPYDENIMRSALLGLPFIIRGRALSEEYFIRMQLALKQLEAVIEEHGAPWLNNYLHRLNDIH